MKKTYFERLNQLETSHTQTLVGKKSIKTLLSCIRANPSYSFEHVKDNVFVVVYAALASVPGHLSMKHDTSGCISFRLFSG